MLNGQRTALIRKSSSFSQLDLIVFYIKKYIYTPYIYNETGSARLDLPSVISILFYNLFIHFISVFSFVLFPCGTTERDLT